MDHITHLRNQFKSINTVAKGYKLYHNITLERKKPIISFLITELSLFVKPWVPFNKGCFVPSFVEVEIGSVVHGEKILSV